MTPAAMEEAARNSDAACPDCGKNLVLSVSPVRPFTAHILPRLMGRCPNCATRVDMRTGLVLP